MNSREHFFANDRAYSSTMDANNFITKLKADGSSKDTTDLHSVTKDYQSVLTCLPSVERGAFSINVLCTLVRNLQKVPQWVEGVDKTCFATMSIECMRQARCVEDKELRVKQLACSLHLHRYIVAQPLSIPPEIVLKLSYMPFEPDNENLLVDYSKTYWGILADRLTYLDRLKSTKRAIIKLLPKLTEDLLKVLYTFNTVQFCKTILLFLVKKLRVLYSDCYAKDLNDVYGKIFQSLSKKNDLNGFKKVKEEESLELMNILVESVFVIVENCSKVNFNDSPFESVIRICISLIGHNPDIFHCLQTLYLNSFCCILRGNSDFNFTENILNNLQKSCETSERFGYVKTMQASYPYLSQFVRLFIDFAVTNYEGGKKEFLTTQIQESCLKLILFLMKKLKTTEQMLKCENCTVKTGLHDSLRLSFLIKNIMTVSLKENNDITNILTLYLTITTNQYEILSELNRYRCVNHEKCFRKLQTDVHNTAISLNKSGYNDNSILLFDLYLKNELGHFKSEIELKNMSRALFNKSICEMDNKLYEDALRNAYLSLVLSLPEGLKSDKHMSLVMDIKSKSLRQCTDNDGSVNGDQDEFQLLTILDCCGELVETCGYGNIGPFLRHLKFTELLTHEYEVYARLWPSVVPVAGVWRSLLDLSEGKHAKWLTAEPKEMIQWCLYEVILSTPAHVRTIHNDYYKNVIRHLLDKFDKMAVNTTELSLVRASLLLLQADFNLTDASVKYGWKYEEQAIDVDNYEAKRTIPQEYETMKPALLAVDLLTANVLKHLDDLCPNQRVKNSLHICHMFIYQLLHIYDISSALQLAYICMRISEIVNDRETYVSSATVIMYHLNKTDTIDMSDLFNDKMLQDVSTDSYLCLLSAAAIYYIRIGSVGAAAKLIRTVQGYVLENETKIHGNLELAVGMLLEAQSFLCQDSNNSLNAVMFAQRHYLAITTTGASYLQRRTCSCRVWQCISRTSRAPPSPAPCPRRARAAAAPALPRAAAAPAAALCCRLTALHSLHEAQVKIDNKLKHILGLQPSNQSQQQIDTKTTNQKQSHRYFTPKRELETVRDCNEDFDGDIFKKTRTSPSLPFVTVPAFNPPSYLSHDDSACQCYACRTPSCLILTCRVTGLEASAYFRAKEADIAGDYFDGALQIFGLVDAKLKRHFDRLKSKSYEAFVLDAARDAYGDDFCAAQIETLIEAALFELSKSNYDRADEYCVRIHEVLEDMSNVDSYLKNDISNLLIASAQLRMAVKVETFVVDMDNLKLSPMKPEVQAKTPEQKPSKPPKVTNKVTVKDEEVPKTKRKVIKLNLDEVPEEAAVKNTRSKRSVFKIPIPITSQPALEDVTPKPVRTKPSVLITQPSGDTSDIGDVTETPRPKAHEFFTPLQSDGEAFFTPMTSVKTYTKKSMRKTIVKNLDSEFSTPKCEKENATATTKGNKLRTKSAILTDKSELCTEIEKLSIKSDNSSSDNKFSAKNQCSKKLNDIVNKTTLNSSDKTGSEKNIKKTVETGTLKSLKDRRVLKRATSPGKLGTDDVQDRSRTRRLRQPTNYGKKDSNEKK